ncbi:MAG: hypothetical protein JXA37_02680 [Chloroflexia bacterium]|nr:hypothetical protein [Chloroflexia bacterium]
MPQGSLEQLNDRQWERDGPAGMWQRLELSLSLPDETGGLWPQLQERVEQGQVYPRLRPGLELLPVPGSEAAQFVLSDPVAERRFRLGPREAFLISRLDGRHRLSDLVGAYQECFGPIQAEAVAGFVQNLRRNGLLEEGRGLWALLGFGQGERPHLLWVWPDGAEKLGPLHRGLRFMFQPLAGAVLLLLLGGAIVLLIVQGEQWLSDWRQIFSSWCWLWLLPALYMVMIPIVLTHELAHALTCIHFGGRVPRVGLMLQHLLPAAFADVSDVWSMPRRRRLAVFLSGPASTAAWAALFTLLWAWSRPGTVPHLLAAAVMTAAYWSAFVSLNPLSGYDGAAVLAELLEVPQLHRCALQYSWARLRGRPLPQVSPRERTLFARYTLAVILYHLTVLLLLGIVCSNIF